MGNNNETIMANGNAASLKKMLASMRHAFSMFETARTACFIVFIWTTVGLAAIWLDMYLHLNHFWRWTFFLLLATALFAGTGWFIFAVLIKPVGERWLSVQVEKRNPGLKNRLITATQILKGGSETQDFDPDFCKRLLAQTYELLRTIDIKPVIPWETLRIPFAIVIISLLAAIVLRNHWNEGFDTALARILMPSADIPVPSRTRISVIPEGISVPRGDNLKIQASLKGKLTEKVSLHLRRPDNDWTIISMFPSVPEGSNTVPQNSFFYEIASVNEPLEYFVSAGDGETKVFKIKVVERPSIRSIQISYKYPEYLGIPPLQKEKGICTVEAPVGTMVEVSTETDSPVVGGQLKLSLQGSPAPVFVPFTLNNPQLLTTHFTLEKSGIYSVLITNSAGLGEKKPLEYPLIAQIDTPPIVEILEPARDMVIEDPQTIPVLASARDDFGLSAMYLSISISNTPSVVTNNGKATPPGRKLVEIAEPSIKNQNAAIQIPCDKIIGFKEKGKITYTVFAVDRKGQIGNSREYTIMLTETAKKRMEEEKLTNALPIAEEMVPPKKPLPAEVAQIQALIEKQKTITENLLKTKEEAQRFRPDAKTLERDIRTAFDQEKKFAGELLSAKSWAQTKLDEISKNPAAQNPQFERTLRMMRDMMDSLRENEVREATAALRNAFLTVNPQGTNFNASSSASAPPPPQQGSPSTAVQGANQPQGQSPSSQPSSQGQQPSQEQNQPEMQNKKISGDDKKQVRQQLDASIANQEEVVNKLEALKQRMEASLPGQLDQATIDALDKTIMNELAEESGEFKKGLQLASQKAKKAAEELEPLLNKQTDLKTKTLETTSEKIHNLAKPQDRLKLDTGHAEERINQEMPWLKPPAKLPEDMKNEPMTASTAPMTQIPPVPQAPRKEVMQGADAPMPQVFQQGGEHPMPKLLVPDKFPDTFRGDLSDKPIPPPPPGATPTGRAPKTSLKKMTEEEKEKLRKSTMLDSLEICDDGMAMGLGAPDNEEMPEEMLLEPGAQYSSGPSAPDSKPGMELGQSAGKVLGNPLQPPAGGGGGGGEDQGGAKPPPSSAPSSNPEGQKPSQTQSAGSPSTASSGGTSGQPLSQIEKSSGKTSLSSSAGVSPAVSSMAEAATALAGRDKINAVAAQSDAIGALSERKSQLARISAFAEGLSAQFSSIQSMLARDDIQRAEALNAIEQTLRNPAWNILNESLAESAEIQLRSLHNRLRKTYEVLGGNAASIPNVGIENKNEITDWAKFTLPPHLRQELIDGLKENAPSAYQQILEEYYRSISKEK